MCKEGNHDLINLYNRKANTETQPTTIETIPSDVKELDFRTAGFVANGARVRSDGANVGFAAGGSVYSYLFLVGCKDGCKDGANVGFAAGGSV